MTTYDDTMYDEFRRAEVFLAAGQHDEAVVPRRFAAALGVAV